MAVVLATLHLLAIVASLCGGGRCCDGRGGGSGTGDDCPADADPVGGEGVVTVRDSYVLNRKSCVSRASSSTTDLCLMVVNDCLKNIYYDTRTMYAFHFLHNSLTNYCIRKHMSKRSIYRCSFIDVG